jgi:hypothetical protein
MLLQQDKRMFLQTVSELLHQNTARMIDTSGQLYWKHFDLPTSNSDKQPGS